MDGNSPGDAALMDRFITVHQEIFLRLLRRGFSHDEAAEGIQEAFLRLRRRKTSKPIFDPFNWLFTVARREAIKVRKQSQQPRISGEPVWDPVEKSDREDEIRVLHPAILRAMDHLPEHLRTVFYYCMVEGHTYAEAAKAFGLNVGMVSGRITRARKAIKATIEKKSA